MSKSLVKITKRREKDLTRSNTILRRYFAEINRHFRALEKAISDHVQKPSTLSGKLENDTILARDILSLTVNKDRYVYERSLDRMKEFMQWLDEQVENGIMAVEKKPWLVSPNQQSLWADTYIQAAYQKGIEQARADLASMGITLPTLSPVSVAMNRPFHADRLGLIYSRTFNGMKYLTDAMKNQIGRVLAQGMGEGRSPYDIAYKMKDRVEKIGITRARLIARTEVIFAHNEASLNEFESLEGLVGETIKVQWWTAMDERVRGKPGGMYPKARPSHWAWHGKVYTRQQAKEKLGAPNCLLGHSMCYSPSNIEGTFKRFYNGPLVVLTTSNGNELSCTPNHPILSEFGLVPACLLNKGDAVFQCSMRDSFVSIGTNENHIVSAIQDIFSAFSLSEHISTAYTAKTAPLDFHGDGAGSDVAVINTNRRLLLNRQSSFSKIIRNPLFSIGVMENHFGSGFCSLLFDFLRISLTSSCGMRFFGLLKSFIRRHLTPFQKLSLTSSSNWDVFCLQMAKYCYSMYSELHSNVSRGLSFDVQFDNIVNIDFREFSGHVYNLQTKDGFYFATDKIDQEKEKVNTFITGNCRCAVLPYTQSIADKLLK